MDITQIPFKINQTNQSDVGKRKFTSQTNVPENSFDQILARFNFSGQTLKSDRQSASSTIQNESDKEDSNLIERTYPSEEDWLELDSVLAALIAGIQYGQYSQETSQDSTINLYSENKTIIPAKSPMVGSLEQTTIDDSKELAQLLQKVENTNLITSLDPAQLIQQLSGKLIDDVQLLNRQNSIEIPVDIGDKIQMILDESKTENKFVGTTPVVRQSYKNPFLFDNEIQAVSLNNMQDGKTAASPLQNVSETKGIVQTELSNLSTEDGWKINTSFALGTQQGQYLYATPRGLLENSYSALDSETPEISGALLSPQHQVTTDESNALAQWLQKVGGTDQTSTSDSSILIQRLAHFIGELQSQEKPNSIEIPINIGGKIQMILDKVLASPSFLYSRFAPKESNQDNQSFSQDDFISFQEQQPFTPAQVAKFEEGSKIDRVPFPMQVEDLTKSAGQTFFVNQQPGSEGWNVSKAVPSTAIISISEFVPEVSGWIGGYLRSTNGQLGSTEARFSLYPEHLGHIEIKITSQQGQITAQILAESGLAKEALEGQLHQLRQALQQQGFLVKNLEIVQQTPVSMDANQANLAFSQGGFSSPHEQRTFTSDQNVNESDETEIEKESLSVPYGGAAPKTSSQIDFTA